MSYQETIHRIRESARRSGRTSDSVLLVAISKGRATEAIQELYDQGHRDFGENRAQELAAKVPVLPDDIRWHFVGPLQTNKVRIVRSAASALHSLDRDRLADAWVKGPSRPPPAFLQINLGLEPQKSGYSPDDAGTAYQYARSLGIEVMGLMAIPPMSTDPDVGRGYFRELRSVADRIHTDHRLTTHLGLSMGMTDDFETAIEEGATVVRVGRAIFGETREVG